MIIIPPEEVDEFLANESGGIFKNYEDAVEAVNMANHVNPGIKHWVEEVV